MDRRIYLGDRPCNGCEDVHQHQHERGTCRPDRESVADGDGLRDDSFEAVSLAVRWGTYHVLAGGDGKMSVGMSEIQGGKDVPEYYYRCG